MIYCSDLQNEGGAHWPQTLANGQIASGGCNDIGYYGPISRACVQSLDGSNGIWSPIFGSCDRNSLYILFFIFRSKIIIIITITSCKLSLHFKSRKCRMDSNISKWNNN